MTYTRSLPFLLVIVFGSTMRAQLPSSPSSITTPSAQMLLVGAWRDENSVTTFRSDGTFALSWDNGAEARGQWRINQDLIVRTTTCQKISAGGWSAGLRADSSKVVEIDQTHFRYSEGASIWNARRVPPPADDPITRIACEQAAAQRRENDSVSTNGNSVIGSWLPIRESNATAVTALIAAVKAKASLATAFSTCGAHHSDLIVTTITQSSDQISHASESKSQIQAWQDFLSEVVRNRLVYGEGVCVWKVVAWANGVMSFDPTQFRNDPSLNRMGQSTLLNNFLKLQCRTVGEPIGVFNARSVECATGLAVNATASVRNPDLTDKAFERLAQMLVAAPPLEWQVATSAIPEYTLSRLSSSDLLVSSASLATSVTPKNSALAP